MNTLTNITSKNDIRQPEWHDDIGFHSSWDKDQQWRLLDQLSAKPNWRCEQHLFGESLIAVLDDFAEFNEEFNFPYPSPAWAYIWQRKRRGFDAAATHAQDDTECALLVKFYDDGAVYHELRLSEWGVKFFNQHLPYRDAGYPVSELVDTLETYQRIAKLHALIDG